MPYIIAACLMVSALVVPVAVVLLLSPHGRHEADSFAAADWTPATPKPEPSPVRLWQPRSCPDTGTVAPWITEAYASLERTTQRYLDEIAAWPVSLHE